MVKVEDALIARYESKGHRFEVLIDQKLVDLIKSGKSVNVSDYMAADMIFKDSSKGDRASEEVIKEVFGTDDFQTVVTEIVKKGQVQLTTEQRRKMLEEKRRQIVEIISRESMNPQSGSPHPPQRIEKAMEEAKVRVDPFKSAEEQVNDVLKAIRVILPIKFEHVKMEIEVPGTEYGKIYAEMTRLGQIVKEEWKNNGNYGAVIEIPAGVQDQLYDFLNKRTKGNVDIKLIK
ncbi:MAG: ribosome assembly factor SBDS [Candidatus Thermoplasmatota archaeon]|jgi:ribosome maturation protein SDO1|nr:ribosome assembly factor SBDS [Candidatus Thermoplasmatota archaeon]MCL5789324.1 ribosome assembly factor SBDS [Candidatus Thermoplasmatota archaeon]